jgi:hypothetical protein
MRKTKFARKKAEALGWAPWAEALEPAIHVQVRLFRALVSCNSDSRRFAGLKTRGYDFHHGLLGARSALLGLGRAPRMPLFSSLKLT